MSAHNIQIGIDLGTTNSEIAVNRNGIPEVVKNIFQDEYTPSVFGVNKANNIEVGRRAYEKLFKDSSSDSIKNYKAEVKRLMGTPETVHFDRLNKDMTAEEISGEILTNLKSDVLRKYPEFDTTAAVITIPAYFSTLQAEATKRAGNLAGFKHIVLLQEPIAAAMAYGFNNVKEETWLVYDLGGGTFDVALISSKAGVLSVLGHNGDNFLGGKNFDWLIVEKIIIPQLKKEYDLSDLDRSNKDGEVQSILSYVKYEAETAKISLSQEDTTSMLIEIPSRDIVTTIDFSRKEFEKLIEPFIAKTIDLAQETIKDAGIKEASVSKVVLVGGPTQIPYVREQLEKALKIEIDSSSDPLTVVAKGACIYAAGQRIPQDILEEEKPRTSGAKELVLDYDPMTAETDVLITGDIKGLEGKSEDYYIQIQGESGYYNSPKIKLKASGKLIETISLEQNKTNLFWIYLFDKKGNSIPVYPESFSITHGLTIAGAPIPHTVGVSILDKSALLSGSTIEKFDIFFERGSTLPLKKTKSYQLARKLAKNDNVNELPIKVLEGESDNPNNNDFICKLGIKGSDLPHDLPDGTDIDLTITINESRQLDVEYYIPSVDISGRVRATIVAETIDSDRLHEDLTLQKTRLEKNSDTYTTEDKKKIAYEIESIETSIKHGNTDEDEKRKASKQLKDLKTRMEKLEKGKELPQLIAEFKEKYDLIVEAIDGVGDIRDRERNHDHLSVLKKEGEKAIESEDKTLLQRVIQQISELGAKIIYSNPQTWAWHYNEITQGNHQFSNQKDADYFIDKGKQAMENGDTDELKRCVQNLLTMLSAEEQSKISSSVAGITSK